MSTQSNLGRFGVAVVTPSVKVETQAARNGNAENSTKIASDIWSQHKQGW